MKTLQRGENAAITSTSLNITADIPDIGGAEVDVSAFLVGANGKVRTDGDMCFYGQVESGNGALRMVGKSGTQTAFAVDLSKMPADVEKILITATIHENKSSFQSVPSVKMGIGPDVIVDISCVGMTETALILGEIYRRNGEWKVRAVGQGFNGGLAPLATHLGVSIDDEPVTPMAPAAPVKPVSLTKVKLTKGGESSKISLDKKAGGIVKVTATWIDNGDRRSDNDDLDLRAGLLMPDGKMHWLAASHPGSLTATPYARHLGDVRAASKNAPGTEIIEFDAGISHKLGGPVGLVFSIYSAISNGDVSIASLKPVMTVEYNGNIITCEYTFDKGKAAKGVYTYVIATVSVDKDDLDVKLSGLTSPKGSENTPWIERQGTQLNVSFQGSPVFKQGRTMMARMMGAGLKKYANL